MGSNLLNLLGTQNSWWKDVGKVSVIEDFVRPKTKEQIRQFFGLVGYYRKFIPGFAQ